MIRRSEAGVARVSQIVCSEDPIELALKSYAFELLLPFIDESLLQLLRTIISAADKFPEVGQSFWNIGPVRAHQFLSEMLKDRMYKGEIREADPSQAAHLFLAMCSGRYWFRQLVHVSPPVVKSEFREYADEGIKAFIAIYGLRERTRNINGRAKWYGRETFLNAASNHACEAAAPP